MMWLYLLAIIIGLVLGRLLFNEMATMVARVVLYYRIRAILAAESDDLEEGTSVSQDNPVPVA